MDKETLDKWYVECEHHVRGVVREVVEYCTANQITSAKIIDVGSNVGLFVDGVSKHITVEDAILIEPVDILREYSKELAPQYTYIREPVSDKVQDIHLYVNLFTENLGMSKLMYNPPSDDTVIYTTTTLTLLSREYDFKADIVKIDAEGHDLECVEGYLEYLQETGHKPKLINFERTRTMDFSALSEAFELLGYQTYYVGSLEWSSEVFFIPKGAIPTYHMTRYEKGA